MCHPQRALHWKRAYSPEHRRRAWYVTCLQDEVVYGVMQPRVLRVLILLSRDDPRMDALRRWRNNETDDLPK